MQDGVDRLAREADILGKPNQIGDAMPQHLIGMLLIGSF